MVEEQEVVAVEEDPTTSEVAVVIMTLEARWRRRYLGLLVWITPS